MIVTTTMHEAPWATAVLLVSLAVAFAAIFGKVQPMVFGQTDAAALPHPPALVLLLGLYIPPFLVEWYHHAARFIG